MDTYKVYIKIDSKNKVIAVNSSEFIPDITGWIKIDEGQGDKYHHAQGNYLNKPLINLDRTHNYIYENNAVRETTEAEKATELASFPAPQPTPEEKLRADIEYLSAMTGVTL
ncbi:MAG: hypothetical protein AB9836_05960 [Aminipila sp.]